MQVHAATPIARRSSPAKAKILRRVERRLGQRCLEHMDAPALVRWATSGEVAATTAQGMLATLSGVFSAVEAAGVQVPHRTAPADALRHLRTLGHLPPSRRNPPRISEAQIRAILAAWTGRVPSWPLPFLVDAAWRSGELCRLRWEDVDMSRGIATIRDRKSPCAQMHNDQRVPLLGRSRSILAMVANTDARKPLPYSQPALSIAFRNAARGAGLAGLHLHDLRHEAISRLFDAGWTIPEVAAVSGHRSWRQLERYTHPDPERLLRKATTCTPRS